MAFLSFVLIIGIYKVIKNLSGSVGKEVFISIHLFTGKYKLCCAVADRLSHVYGSGGSCHRLFVGFEGPHFRGESINQSLVFYHKFRIKMFAEV
jgi:hypothetical protein